MASFIQHLILVVLILHGSLGARQSEIEQFLDDRKACQIDSPYRDKCIKRALDEALPKVAKGIRALNISPIDPLFVREARTNYRRGISLLANGKVQNVRILGLSKTLVQSVKSNINKTHIQIEVRSYLPKMFMEGLYEGKGQFGPIPLDSKGYFNVTAAGITINSRATGVLRHYNGERYLQLTHFDIDPTISYMKFHATGLVQNPTLNQLMMNLVNQYWSFFYRQMLPETKTVWEPILIKDVNKFLIRVPIRRFLYYSYERHKLIIKS